MIMRVTTYTTLALALSFCIMSSRVGMRSAEAGHVAEPSKPAAHALDRDDWHSEKTINGMAAEIAGQAQTPDGPAKVRLSFECTAGKGGTNSVVFVVLGATKLKGFDFDNFEGPDAPASAKPLVTFTVHRTSGADVVVKTTASGSYTVTDEGFAFEVSTAANAREGKVAQLTDAVVRGAASISVRVQGFKDPQKTIQVTFSTNGAAEVVGQAMKACAKR
jgi:hypothetical protein